MRKGGLEPDKQLDRRWIILGVVAVAILLVIAIKLGRRSASPASADAMISKDAPAELPVEVASEASSDDNVSGAVPTLVTTVVDPGQDAPVATSVESDPYPEDPTAQVEWVVRNNRPAMVLFHSRTCVPCKAMEKLVGEVRADYEPDITFIDVITDDRSNSELVRQASIRAIPTTFFIRISGEGQRAVGAVDEETLRGILDELLKEAD